MDQYLESYDKFEKTLVYSFTIQCGGLGDLIKFFMYSLYLCIKNNTKIKYLIHNNTIEKYLKLKQPKMYITREEINNQNTTIVTPLELYGICSYDCTLPYKVDDVFYFSDEVIHNSINYQLTDYISIHLRLGDKYLETDKKYVICENDERLYDKDKMIKFIEDNRDTNIMFFCDNKQYKKDIKEKFTNIFITDYDIGHTGLTNTTEIQVINTITDFF